MSDSISAWHDEEDRKESVRACKRIGTWSQEELVDKLEDTLRSIQWLQGREMRLSKTEHTHIDEIEETIQTLLRGKGKQP
jgi:hypothetical protein